MPRVLICEPDPDVQSLIAFVARRSGHEPLISDGTLEQARTADVVVLEPGNAEMLALAQRLSTESPDLPIICVSIYPPQEIALPLRPVSYLVKPFSVDELGGALSQSVSLSDQHPAPTPGQSPRPPIADLAPSAMPPSAVARPTPERNSHQPRMRAGSTALADPLQEISIEDLRPLDYLIEDETIPADWRIRLQAIKRRREFVVIVGGRS